MDGASIAEEAGKSADAAMDAETRAKIKIAEAIGPEGFEENTRVLKQMAMRGLRAFVVVGVGLVAFSIAFKRKKRQLAEAEEAKRIASGEEDPTARYLKEMEALGFDVQGHEDDLQKDKKSKAN